MASAANWGRQLDDIRSALRALKAENWGCAA